jgi:hypothetical protein
MLLACATVMALSTSSVWAGGANGNPDEGKGDSKHFKVPKIDAKPWKNAIAQIKGAFHERANSNHDEGKSGSEHFKAPEIDAASGTSAIALLTGVLLLAGERARSRRSSKTDV